MADVWPEEKNYRIKDGVCYFANHAKFFGTMLDDKIHGPGKYVYASWTFEGEFKAGHMTGICNIHDSSHSFVYNFTETEAILMEAACNSSSHTFQLKVEKQLSAKTDFSSQQALKNLTNPISFHGHYYAFKYDCVGKVSLPNGEKYSGNFRYKPGESPIYYGKGSQTNGDNSYVGSYEDGKPNGFGKSVMGFETYEGLLSKGKRDGPGYLTIRDFRKPERIYLTFEGNWSEGYKSGTGVETVYRDDGSVEVYRGTWSSGSRHGFFEVTVNGRIFYAGLFAHGTATQEYRPITCHCPTEKKAVSGDSAMKSP